MVVIIDNVIKVISNKRLNYEVGSSKRMKKKSLMIYGILLIMSLAFISCTTTATQTFTTTKTIPQTTFTQTISSTEVMNFLAGIKNIYTNGGCTGRCATAQSHSQRYF